MFADPPTSHQVKEGAGVTVTVAAASTRGGMEGVSEVATALVEQSDTVKSEEEVEMEEKGSQTDFHEISTMGAPPAEAAGNVPQLVPNGDMEGVVIPSQSLQTSSVQRNPSPVPKPGVSRVRRSKREFLECAPIGASG